MKVVDFVQRVVLYALIVPVLVILIDATLTFFDSQEDNAVVAFFADAAEAFTPEVLTTMFVDQQYWQTAALAVLFYGLVALLVALVFRLLRAIIATVADMRRKG